MMVFQPLDMHGSTRIDRHRAARLAMLRGRIVKKMAKIDHAADEVEQALAVFVQVTHQPASLMPGRRLGPPGCAEGHG